MPKKESILIQYNSIGVTKIMKLNKELQILPLNNLNKGVLDIRGKIHQYNNQINLYTLSKTSFF